jgi:multisubunit Na+/H+ antiporter MnhC subunit
MTFFAQLFKKPRLIVDWEDVDEHHGPHIISQELFFNVCFAVLFGSLRAQFASGSLSGYQYLREFLLSWALVNNAADYASRFNDDDAFHTMMWGVYGGGLVGTLMHIQNQVHYSIAMTQLWLGIAWLRVAFMIQRCRVFALLETTCLTLTSASIIFVGYHDLRDDWIGFVPVLIQPIGTILMTLLLPHAVKVPLNVEYHHPKFQGMAMVIMGQLVIVAATPPASGEGPHDVVGFYRDAISTVVMLVMFKLIMTDCDVTLVENHAIKRSKISGLVWSLLCQPLLNLSVVSCAAGIMFLHKGTNDGNYAEVDNGKRIISFSCTGLFLAVSLAQTMHARERALREFSEVYRCKKAYYALIAACSIVCFSLQSLPVDPLPIIAILTAVVAKVGWWTKSLVLTRRKQLEQAETNVALATKP